MTTADDYDRVAHDGMSMHPIPWRGVASDIVAPRWVWEWLERKPYQEIILVWPRMAGKNYFTEEIRKAIEAYESSHPQG